MAIAAVKYFNGTQELRSPIALANDKFATLFPGMAGKRSDSFHKWVGFLEGVRVTFDGKGSVPVTRIIEFKRNPSLHKCDGRCVHAKGRQCECSCGGKNHGAGSC